MAPRAIRVGLIGVSASRGWATLAHIPALRGLPEYRLEAIASSRQASADQVAEKFGVPLAFSDPDDLARHPDVDVVAITVRVTEHDRLVRAALAAGKHVFCEWPLGVDPDQARRLADLAAATPVRTVVGLQGYRSPGALTVARLLGRGTIGQLAAVSLTGVGGAGAASIGQANAYTLRRANGATIHRIYAAHWLATLEVAVGRLRSVAAAAVRARDEMTIEETGECVPVDAPDQVALCGVLDRGALLSVAVHNGLMPDERRFELRLTGTEGTLLVEPAGPGSFHMADWRITLLTRDGVARTLPGDGDGDGDGDLAASIPPGPPRHVAGIYRELSRALTEGRAAMPDFGAAVCLHNVVNAVERATATGMTQDVMCARQQS